MDEIAGLISRFDVFFPFCKTHSGVDSYVCTIKQCAWVFDTASHRLIFRISANRFLRGMVRLIVGACVQAGQGQIEVGAIRAALENQTALKQSLSVPPQGLALTDVKYPYDLSLRGGPSYYKGNAE